MGTLVSNGFYQMTELTLKAFAQGNRKFIYLNCTRFLLPLTYGLVAYSELC